MATNNYNETMLVGIVVFSAMFIIALIACICIGKNLMDRINQRFFMNHPEKAYVNVVKYDYEKVGGPQLVQ